MKSKLVVHCERCGKTVEGDNGYEIIHYRKWRLYIDKLSSKRRKTAWCCPDCKPWLDSLSRIRVGAS